jgi:hypothetical protein
LKNERRFSAPALSNKGRWDQSMSRAMNGHVIVNKLSAYLDGELSAAEREQVESHLGVCHACREQLVKHQRMWRSLGEMAEIRPTPDFYERVSRKIDQASERGGWGSLLGNWGLKALPSPLAASVILAIGILCGTYIGNSLINEQPFHHAAAHPVEGLLSSLRVFDPVPPGTLADNYERLLSHNESRTQ